MALLPAGSIVKLSGTSADMYMIAGYYPQDGDMIWDYSAVEYPGGMGANGEMHTFYADEITEILHVGYTDETAERLLEKLPEYVTELFETAKEYEESMNGKVKTDIGQTDLEENGTEQMDIQMF